MVAPRHYFLTRRIDYFRTQAPSLANTRKPEALDNEAQTSQAFPQAARRRPFLPLYGANRPHFSIKNRPCIEISMGWIGESMGWKWKSMGCFGRRAAWTGENLAKRRTKVGVRFNCLPYSAQGVASAVSPLPCLGALARKSRLALWRGAAWLGAEEGLITSRRSSFR